MSLQEARTYNYYCEIQPELGFSTLQHQTEFYLALTIKIKRTDTEYTGVTHDFLRKFKLFELKRSSEDAEVRNSKFLLLKDFAKEMKD